MKHRDEQWAVFWCTLLAPVLFGEVDGADVNRLLKKLAQQEQLFPNGVRKKPSLSTLRRKLRKYRKAGFEGLARKTRCDRGRPRAHDAKIIDKAIELKRDQPRRSDETINQFLKAWYGKTLPKSTLYRLLKQAGATRIKLGVTRQPVRRRWTKDQTHALWVGDFEEGPYVLHQRQPVPTHLCAWIDGHSRLIVEGRYYYRQNLDILIDSLLRAWTSHGTPLALYVDNAKVYHAKALQAACFRLHIRLLHRKAADPAGGGLIERFFETAQSQFEAEVRAGDILSLDQLNRAFSAWLSVSYHKRPNDQTKQSPESRYQQGLAAVRHVDMDTVLESFMRCETRRVHFDFSDVQLHGRFYRVDKRLRGDKVEVRYDPFGLCQTVLIYSLDQKYLGKGVLHQRQQGEAPDTAPPAKAQYNYLDLLIDKHEAELAQRAAGIDFRRAMRPRPWPLHAFAKRLAQLLGRKGQLTALRSAELETLQKFYSRHPGLTQPMLTQAVEKARDKTIPCVLYELGKLVQAKET
jgi:transposase InsO family protein